MKRIYLVAILFAVSLIAANELSLDDDIPTECPEEDPMNTTILLPHENDCTKFYMCLAGEKIEKQCPFKDKKGNRLHFNPKKQTCDWPGRAGCKTTVPDHCPDDTQGKTIQLPHKTNCENFYLCMDGTKELARCPDGYLFSKPLKKCDIAENVKDCRNLPTKELPFFQCPADTDGKIIMIPHETNCQYFYICADGITILAKCADGYLFSKALGKCDIAKNVKDCPNPPELTKQPTKEPPTDHCPDDTQGKTIKLPYKTNCENFYLCTDGTKELARCPDGYLFSKPLKKCDIAENVKDCPNLATKELPFFQCPADTDGKIIMIPHETNCQYFYICADGITILAKCADGYLFSKALGKCDIAENVKDCPNLPKLIKEPTEQLIHQCPANNNNRVIKLPHETKCDHYYFCWNGKGILRRCLDGYLFSEALQKCDFAKNVKDCPHVSKPTEKLIE